MIRHILGKRAKVKNNDTNMRKYKKLTGTIIRTFNDGVVLKLDEPIHLNGLTRIFFKFNQIELI